MSHGAVDADRSAGLLLGSFVGDALALGLHWIYEPEKIAEALAGEPLAGPRDPLPDSYHPNKRAGDQSHVGDQALVLLRSLRARGGRFDPDDFGRRWHEMWKGYDDHIDHATTHRLDEGAAGPSDELAGPARVAPLLVPSRALRREDLFDALTAQTALTHAGVLARSTAWLLGELTLSARETGSVAEALARVERVDFPELPLREWLARVRAMPPDDAVAAAGELGRACPIPQALPAALWFLAHRGDDLRTALIDNVMAGGDNCARGLVLGMVLGAAHGASAIPAAWIDALTHRDEISDFCRDTKTLEGRRPGTRSPAEA